MAALVDELRRRQSELADRGAGGDDASIQRHRDRGKLPVRDRIDRLLDPGSPFLELSPLAANGLYDDDAPGAGIVTGIGQVEGTTCACSMLPMASESRQPKPCAVVYSVARCDAMTDIVAADIDKNRDDVTAVAIVPDAPPGGVHLSAGWHIRVRIALRDGTIHDKEICGGVLHEPA